MKYWRKLISLNLVLAMLLGLLPLSAFAEETAPEETAEMVLPTGGLPVEECVGVALPEGISTFGLETAAAESDLAGLETALMDGWKAGDETIDISAYGISTDGFEDAYFGILYDNPQIYYVKTSVNYSYTSDNMVVSVTPAYLDGVSSAAQQTAFDSKLDNVLDQCTGGDDLQTALALHDYLALNCAYNWEVGNGGSATDDLVYTAYGALMNGDAVCQGYALAYNALLHRAGIEAKYVKSDAQNHGWSLVNLDGRWYHVDLTWDDPMWTVNGTGCDMPGYVQHDYFMVSDETIQTMTQPHHTYTVEGLDVEGIAADSALYESGYVFNGARTAFFTHNGSLYYMTKDGSVVAADSTLSNTTPTAYDYNYTIRWSAAYEEGMIYYTYVEGHFQSTETMEIFCYDIEADSVQPVLTVTGSDLTQLGIVYDGEQVCLLRANGTATPEQIALDIRYHDTWGRPYIKNEGSNVYENPAAVFYTGVSDAEIAAALGVVDAFSLNWYDNGAYNGPVEFDAVDEQISCGGQGVVLEVYENEIVRIDTYLAEVVNVTAVEYDKKGHVRTNAELELDIWHDSGTPLVITLTSDVDYLYTVGDMLLVKYNEGAAICEIVDAAQTLIGTQTASDYTNTHVINGKEYPDAEKFYLDEAGLNDTLDHIWYFDTYGNLIGVAEIPVEYDYGVITSIYWRDGRNDEEGYARAEVTFVDGVTTVVDISKIDGITLTGVDGKQADLASGLVSSTKQYNEEEYVNNALYEIAIGDTCALTSTTLLGADAQVQTGVATIQNGVADATDATQFLIWNGTAYEAYTGIENVPSFQTGTYWVAEVGAADMTAEYVFIVADPLPETGSRDALFFSEEHDKLTVKTHLANDSVEYYTISGGLVNGVEAAAMTKIEAIKDFIVESQGRLVKLEMLDGYVVDAFYVLNEVVHIASLDQDAVYLGAVRDLSLNDDQTVMFAGAGAEEYYVDEAQIFSYNDRNLAKNIQKAADGESSYAFVVYTTDHLGYKDAQYIIITDSLDTELALYVNGTCGENLTWVLDSDGVLTISGTGAMDDYETSGTAPWYAYRDSITKVVIEDGVTSVGDAAFSGLQPYYTLTEISIGADVRNIGHHAFSRCDSVASVHIPTHRILMYLEDDAFHQNTTVTYAEDYVAELVSGTCGDELTWKIDSDGVLVISGTGDMHDYASGKTPWYAYRQGITQVVVEEGVTGLTADAFRSCSALTKAALPDSLTKLSNSAFSSCSKLADVTLPDTMTELGDAAFFGCYALQQIALPASLQVIGDRAFVSSGLTAVTLPAGLQTIGDNAFYSTNLVEVVIPDNVTEIGIYAFGSCSALTSVTLGEGLTALPAYLFSGCTNLTQVTWPAGLETVGEFAFYNTAITEAHLGDGVTGIDNSAFADNNHLATVTIGSGITRIGESAFANCPGLTSVTVDNYRMLMDVADDAFPAHVTPVFKTASDDTVIRTWNKDDLTVELTFGGTLRISGSGYVSAGEAFPGYAYRDNITDLVVEPGITGLNGSAFAGYTALNSVSLPESLTYIGYGAFKNCPATMTVFIDNYALLVDIESTAFPEGVTPTFRPGEPAATVVASGACGANLTWTLNSEGLLTISGTGDMYNYTGNISSPWYEHRSKITRVIIESGVTSVGDYMFQRCAMTQVTLPEGITRLGADAFYYCSNLTAVTIPGTVTEWNYSTFSDCSNLQTVTIGEGVTEIPYNAFEGNRRLQSVTIPATVTTVGMSAFENCTSLTAIDLNQVEAVKPYAFRNCSNLSQVNFGSKMQWVDEQAFQNCALTEVTLPDSIYSIGNYAFHRNTGLTSLTIGAGVREIDSMAFAETGLTAITVAAPREAIELAADAFPGNAIVTYGVLTDDLVIDTWPAGVNATATLYGDFTLKVAGQGQIRYQDSSGRWEYYRDKIKAIAISDGIENIRSDTFAGHTALETVTMGSDIEVIRDYAFSDCTALKAVKIDATKDDVSVSTYAFSNCHPDLVITYLDGDSLTSSGTCGKNLTWTLKDGLLTISGKGAMEDYARESPWYGEKVTKIVMEKGVTYIGEQAFAELDAKSVDIPDTVTEIGARAFAESSLTGVDIPDSVETIGDEAFYGCGSLSEVTIGTGIREIGGDAFVDCNTKRLTITIAVPPYLVNSASDWVDDEDCVTWAEGDPNAVIGQWYVGADKATAVQATQYGDGRLTILGQGDFTVESIISSKVPKAPWNNVTSVEIGPGVTNVAEYAFDGMASLTEVTLGEDVIEIGAYAFDGCTGLKSIDLRNVQIINSGAFRESGLTTVKLGQKVEYVYSRAFRECNSLKEVYVLGDTYFSGADIFADCTRLNYVQWHEGRISNTGESIFRGSGHKGKGITLVIGTTNLRQNEFGGGFQSIDIPAKMFYTSTASDSAPNLVAVQVQPGARIYSVGEFAFCNCPDLETVDMGEHLQVIDESAFEGCTGLSQVTVPNSLQSIGQNAFRNTGLDQLTLGARVEEIGANAFFDSAKLTLQVAEGSYAHTYAVENTVPFALRTDLPVFTIDGITCVEGTPAAAEDGSWEYNGNTFVYLRDYNGGSVALPGNVCLITVGSNTINGDITAAGELTLMVGGTLTVNSGSETAITATDLCVSNTGDLTVTTTADAAVKAEFVRFHGGKTVNVSAGIAAVQADVLKIDNHDIYLSETADESARAYDGGPYLRLAIHTYTYTLHANGGIWEDETGSAKVVEVPVITRPVPDNYNHLLSRPGYLHTGWETEDGRTNIGEFLPGDVIYAIWAKDVLLVGDSEYPTDQAASGTGWTFTPADGDNAAAMTLTADYAGEAISISESLTLTVNGPVNILAPAGTPAVKALGSLTLELYGNNILRGGAGANAIEAERAVSVNNYGKTAIYGGEGGAGISNGGYMVRLVSKDQLVIVGGLRCRAVDRSLDLREHQGGTVILMDGADCERDYYNGYMGIHAAVKLYAGENANDLQRYTDLSECEHLPYIRLQPKTILVTFDANGGQMAGQATATAELVQNEAAAVILQAESLPAQAGHQFAGWNTAADGSGDSYANGDSYTAVGDQETLTLFAQWVEVDFTAEISADGKQAYVTLADSAAVSDGDKLMLVAYDTDGRMLHCAYGSKGDQTWVFDILQDEAITDWKLYQVSGDYRPQADTRDVLIAQ